MIASIVTVVIILLIVGGIAWHFLHTVNKPEIVDWPEENDLPFGPIEVEYEKESEEKYEYSN